MISEEDTRKWRPRVGALIFTAGGVMSEVEDMVHAVQRPRASSAPDRNPATGMNRTFDLRHHDPAEYLSVPTRISPLH